MGLDQNDFEILLRLDGWNAVDGLPVEAETKAPREIGLLFVATASSQELATQIAKTCNPWFFHLPIEQEQVMPSYGFAFSPAEIEKGQVYEFIFTHVAYVADGFELVRTVFVESKEYAHV